jgi:hypothetical protein
MRYNEYRYLWPPRPGSKQVLNSSRIAARERDGFWAQIKKQGTSNILHVGPDRLVKAVNRHHGDHKLWQPIPQTHATFANLPGSGWYVFCAELMHSKVADPRLKNINYIHDVLVADGEYLVGTTFAQRQDMLASLFPDTVQPINGVGYRVIDPYTWLAINHAPNPNRPGSFEKLFFSLTKPEDEGLVFKSPTAKLNFCHSETANDSWQWKVRRPTKNFAR